MLKIGLAESQLFEVRVVRDSLNVAGSHDASQSSLNKAMYLTKLANLPSHAGLKLESIAQYDLAKILWGQGEMTASIQMLRQLRERDDLPQGAIVVSRSEILAELVSNFLSRLSCTQYFAGTSNCRSAFGQAGGDHRTMSCTSN